MRRGIRLLAKCYPRAWRERYGVEFDALMEDVEPDLQEFTNVLGGAVKLQLASGTALWKFLGVMALVGILASVGAWKLAPQRYVSTAQLRVTPPDGGDVAKAQADQDLDLMLQTTLSRGSLMEIIQRPSLNLYRAERMRIPVEDVIQQMRSDIMVRRDREGSTFSVSFAYPDRLKSPAVLRELTRKLVEGNAMVARNREFIWLEAWKEHAPPGVTVEPAAPPSYPSDPEPRLSIFLAWGFGVGLALGVLVFAIVRQPRLMRQLALCGMAGCVLGGAASFLMPETFVSEVVMRITPPVNPARWYAGTKPESFVERVERLKNAVLGALKNGSERNISIQLFPTTSRVGTARISATGSSALQAQSLASEVVSGFLEQFITEETAREGDDIRYMAERRLGPHIDVLDPPSLPQTPASPNRALMASLGLLAGLLAGALMSWRRRPSGPAMTAVPQPI
ncbi:MAG: hypothetical protein ABI806_08905 [Candidatus Solibacter sp.]